jgi:hypothetical protein
MGTKECGAGTLAGEIYPERVGPEPELDREMPAR